MFQTGMRVYIDGTGAAVGSRVVTRSLDDINKKAEQTSTYMDRLRARLFMVGGTAVAFYTVGTAIRSVIDSLRYLGDMESSTLGIASSFMALGKYVDTTTGKTLQGASAMKMAQIEAAAVMEKLKVANLQTIATLDQLVKVYQETLPVAMSKGFNREQVQEYTLLMVQAAGALKVPLDMLGEETRSLLTGAITTRNSRIAVALGITPEDIKKVQGDVTAHMDFLKEKLAAFKIAGKESMGTWAGLWSNFKDLTQQVKGSLFAGVFDAIKQGLKDITHSIMTIDEKSGNLKFNPAYLKAIEELKPIFTSLGSGTVGVLQSIASGLGFLAQHAQIVKTVLMSLMGIGIVKYMGEIAATALMAASNWTKMHLAAAQGNFVFLGSKVAAVQAARANLQLVQAENAAMLAGVKNQTAVAAATSAASLQKATALTAVTQANIRAAEAEVAATLAEKQRLIQWGQSQLVGTSRVANAQEIAALNVVLAEQEAVLTKAIHGHALAQYELNEATIIYGGTVGANAAKVTAAQATAATAASAATAKLATAQAACTMTSRVLAGVTAGLNVALSLVGGTIGALIIAVGYLTYKWIQLSQTQERVASMKAGITGSGYVAEKLDEISAKEKILKDQENQNKTPAQLRASAQTEADVAKANARRSLVDITAKLTKIEKDREQGGWLRRNFKDNMKETETYEQLKSLKLNAERTLSDADKLAARKAELDARLKYQQDPMRPDTGGGGGKGTDPFAGDKALDTAYEAYSKAFDERILEQEKATQERKLSILADSYEQGLMTTKNYEMQKLEVQNEAWQKEKDQAQGRADAEMALAKKYEAEEASGKHGVAAQAAKFKALENYEKEMKKVIEVTAKMESAALEANQRIAKSNRELAQSLLEAKSEYLALLGLYEQSEKMKQQKSWASPERQKLMAEAAGGNAQAQELMEYLKLIDEINKKKSKQMEIDKQASKLMQELSKQENAISAKEDFYAITKKDAAQERIRIYTQEIQIMRQQQEACDTLTDQGRTAYQTLENSIQGVTDKLRDQTLAMQEQTGTFNDGMKNAFDKYVMNMQTAFQDGVQIVETSMGAVQSSMTSVFSDFLSNEMKSASDYVKQFGKAITDVLAQIIVKEVAVGILESIGFSKDQIANANANQMSTSMGLAIALGGEALAVDTLAASYLALAAAKTAAGMISSTVGSFGDSSSIASAAATTSNNTGGYSLLNDWSGPSFATGIDYVPYDMIAKIHRGEKVVTADNNRNSAPNVTVNVINTTGDDTEATIQNLQFDPENMVFDLVISKMSKSPDARKTMKGMLR